jgi:DNA mismatch repair protein MutL
MGIGVSTALDSGLGRFNLSGVADDRQTVAGWFEPSAAKAQFAPAPPAWARSLPIGFDVGPGEAFDEFSEVIPPSRSAPVPYSGVEPPLAPEAHSRASNGSEHARPTASEGESNYVEATSSAEAGLPTESHAPLSNHRDLGLKAIQVHDSYLIAETGDGMIVIDQHALHERILYEELRARVARGQVESQRLLVPEPVDLTPAEAALLLERTDVLGQLGLEIEPFGGDTILVRSVPAMLPHVVPERLVRDLADHFRTQPLPPTRDGLLAEILHMVACKAAVKAGQPLTPTEVSALLERRHLVADSHHCPHGRPTALVFTKADLEKQFGRI